jgi:hypothetical protein
VSESVVSRFVHRLVDSSVLAHCLAIVLRLRHIFAAVFALTVWLGASQHCNLEAVGILSHQEEGGTTCCPSSTDGCHTDGCKVVESAAYRVATNSTSLLVPDFAICGCLFCLSLVVPPSDDALCASVRTSIDRMLPWVPTWHFDRRTVAAPGAPSFLAA